MNKKLSLMMLLLLLQGAVALYAQDSSLVGFRLEGGAQYAVGAGQGKDLTAVQPMGGAGIYFNISPRFRAGLDYDYSRMIREQINGTLEKQPDGGVAGDVYSDRKTHFHCVTATGEFNFLPSGPFSLYASAGAGVMMANGNLYTMSIKNELKPGGAGNLIQIKGHNEAHSFVATVFPVSLSLEYMFIPRVSVCLKGGYRFVIAGKNEYAPNGQAFALLGLRFNL